ncbi:DUF6492 family protein [Haliangium sp.]|uniref:DUF6492 family protein n=1 Tax=Haliangium sp. TaxID=2663208 RepID=UPI003D0E71CD
MPATCDIFIRSYWKDLAWLEHCLAAIARFCRGFREVIVVVPRATRPWLARHPDLGRDLDLRLEFCVDYRDDYLGQQATKLYADTRSDADFICHIDSDCIVSRQLTPEDLVPAGKPVVVTRPYAQLGRHWPWQRPTEQFLGWPVSHDFMQRPPFTFPRSLYAALRAHALAVHGVALDQYVTTRPARGFSEFNALGAYARARCPDDFVWIDDGVDDPGPPPCRWYWSWAGLDEATEAEISALLSHGEGDHP